MQVQTSGMIVDLSAPRSGFDAGEHVSEPGSGKITAVHDDTCDSTRIANVGQRIGVQQDEVGQPDSSAMHRFYQGEGDDASAIDDDGLELLEGSADVACRDRQRR